MHISLSLIINYDKMQLAKASIIWQI